MPHPVPTSISDAPPSPVAPATPPDPLAPVPSPLALPAFRRLLLMQATFGVAYSIFLILPKYLATHLHASTGLIGWIMASAAVVNVVTAPLIGRIAGPTGARRGMVIGNLAMAAGSITYVFVASPGLGAVVGRALQGLGWALVFSSAGMFAVALAPRQRMAQAIALHGSANILTNAIGPALAEPAIAAYGPRPVFITAALIALFATYQATQVPAPPAVAAPPPRPAGGTGDGSFPLLFAALMLGVACGVMFTLHQPLALARGITRVSDFLVAYTLAALTVRVGLGRVIDRVGADRAAAGSFLLYGIVVAAMPALRGSVGLAVFGAIFGLAHGIFFPALLALSISSAPEGSRSRVIAGFNAAFNVGGAAVIPFGFLAESYGFVAAFVPVGACTMATGLGLLVWARVLASKRTHG